MIMKRLITLCVCIISFASCQKVWIEDLQEKAYDTIRGIYTYESIIWEEEEPIDIDGDGEASYDYLAEWRKIDSGSSTSIVISNNKGYLNIPYIKDMNAEYGEDYRPIRVFLYYEFKIHAVIEGNDSHLVFDIPDDGSEFTHTGYGEFTLRTKVTLTLAESPDKTKSVTGTILIKFIRTKYQAR